MGLLNLKPARSKAMPSGDPVVDLDALIAEPVTFRFEGKTHVVQPIDTRTYLAVTNELIKIQGLLKSEKAEKKEVIESYAAIFSAVCETISIKDVERMTLAQTGALLQMIMECVSGRAQKKKMIPQTGLNSNHSA